MLGSLFLIVSLINDRVSHKYFILINCFDEDDEADQDLDQSESRVGSIENLLKSYHRETQFHGDALQA